MIDFRIYRNNDRRNKILHSAMAPLAFFCLCNLTPVLAQSVAGSWQIEVKADQASFYKGQSHQKLNVTITNTSSKALWVTDSNPLANYDVVVTDHEGKLVPMTARGQALRDGQNEVFTRVVRASIKSQSSRSTEIDLCSFYDLGVGGYVARVSMKAFTEEDFDAHERQRPAPKKPSANVAITIKE